MQLPDRRRREGGRVRTSRVHASILAAMLFVAAALLAPWSQAWAQQDIAGRYRVAGADPGGATYKGSAEIVKRNDAYQMAWTIGGVRYVGTGLVKNNTLAVVFVPSRGRPGLVVYEIRGDGTLSGQFISVGGQSVGSEVLQPADRM